MTRFDCLRCRLIAVIAGKTWEVIIMPKGYMAAQKAAMERVMVAAIHHVIVDLNDAEEDRPTIQ